jgi:CRP-like cAMP-binding protein
MEWEQLRQRLGAKSGDLEHLSKSPLFAGVPSAAIATLLMDAVVRRYRRNTLLFLQDEPAENFYVVFDGWLKVFRQAADGGESVIGVFGAGEVVAEAAIFANKIYPASCSVADDARLLVIPSASFVRTITTNPEVGLNMLAAMSLRLRYLVRQVEQRTVKSTTERVAAFLSRMSSETTGPVTISLPVDKALIAGRLGMQPETFSRSLSKLRKMGVESSGHRIVIEDIARLRALDGDGHA